VSILDKQAALKADFSVLKGVLRNPNFLKYLGSAIFMIGVLLCLTGIAQSIGMGLNIRSPREEICKVVTLVGIGIPLIFAGINIVLKPARRYTYLIAFGIAFSLVMVAIFHTHYVKNWPQSLAVNVSLSYAASILLLIGILLANTIKKESEIEGFKVKKEIEIKDLKTELAEYNKKLSVKLEIKPDNEFLALKANLSQHVSEIAELQRLFQEFQQDFEGYGWTTSTKIEELEGARKKLIIKLIDINDDLESAIKFTHRDKEGDKIDKDKEMVSRYLVRINGKLDTALKKEGVSPIEMDIGAELYDKGGRNHEIVDVVYTEEYPEGTIVEEGRKGYFLNSKVLRASEVKIAKREKNKEG
jgi:molecular chaperone GrpE (heat shock protein)